MWVTTVINLVIIAIALGLGIWLKNRFIRLQRAATTLQFGAAGPYALLRIGYSELIHAIPPSADHWVVMHMHTAVPPPSRRGELPDRWLPISFRVRGADFHQLVELAGADAIKAQPATGYLIVECRLAPEPTGAPRGTTLHFTRVS